MRRNLKCVKFSFFVALPAEKRARTFGNGTREGRNGAIYLRDGSQRGTNNRIAQPCLCSHAKFISECYFSSV